MYKLAYFKATNVAGFMSGLGKKTFELDLRNMIDRDIITIIGNNATGKSTFLSLVHPWHTPMDKRSKFILQGKEGTIIREYQGGDGTIIVSRCIYIPKDDTHKAKCYLKIIRGDNETELNPSGNVTTYYSLIYTYFGINSDYVNFAYYSDAITSIVRKSDTQRKLDITNLIPNTDRLEMSYNTINEKYKELRNLMRNVTQKILSLNDEDTIRATLKRIEKDINRFSEEREDLIKKVAKNEGQLKVLTKGKDVDDLIREYQEQSASVASYSSALLKLRHELEFQCKQLGITLPEDNIEFDGIDETKSNVHKYQKKVDICSEHLNGYETKRIELRDQLDSIEKELNESEAILFSLNTQDIDELERILEGYQYRLDKMTYTKNKDSYKDMSYDEAVAFINNLDLIYRMTSALCEEYGQVFNDYFDSDNEKVFAQSATEYDMLIKQRDVLNSKIDDTYHTIMDREQYRKFQHILTKRPATCKDDSCPFIAQALQWNTIKDELDKLNRDYADLTDKRNELDRRVNEAHLHCQFMNDIPQLMSVINSSINSFHKYLHVDINDIKKAFKISTWPQLLDTTPIKQIAAVLSEKNAYEEITKVKIPEVKHSIELAKTSESSKQLVENTCDRLKIKRDAVRKALDNLSIKITASSIMLQRHKANLSCWSNIDDIVTEYNDTIKKFAEAMAKSDQANLVIDDVTKIVAKIKEYKAAIEHYTEEIQDLYPQREQVRFNLIQLDQLKTEKASIETDFMIIEVMRSIIQPGKGLWKEAINIYMYDIRTIANQILMNMFDGNLYLNEFIITDKSFIIPFTHNGNEAFDISVASSSQQSTICMALSLAIISKLIDKYGIMTYDEVDAPLSPANKATFVRILASQMKFVGIRQCFVVSHAPEYYSAYDCGYILFPGAKIDTKGVDYIKIK